MNKKGFSKTWLLLLALLFLLGSPLILLAAAFIGSSGPLGLRPGETTGVAFAASCNFDLSDGRALTAEQIEKYLKDKTNAYGPIPHLPELPAGESLPASGSIGSDVSATAQEFNVNPALMVAIFRAESTYAHNPDAHITRKNKSPGNVKFVDDKNQAISAGIQIVGEDGERHSQFSNWKEGWRGLAFKLKNNYLDKNLTSVEAISTKYLEGDKTRWSSTVNGVMNGLLGGCPESGQLPADLGICPLTLCKHQSLWGNFTSANYPEYLKQNLPTLNTVFTQPRVIILHSTGGSTVESALSTFRNSVSGTNPDDNRYVQFIVDRDGTIYQLMPETKKVAGAKCYNAVPGGISISVENVGTFQDGPTQNGFDEREVAANIRLVKYLMEKYNIAKNDVISHKQADQRAIAAGVPNDRGERCLTSVHKTDPGPVFMQRVLAGL